MNICNVIKTSNFLPSIKNNCHNIRSYTVDNYQLQKRYDTVIASKNKELFSSHEDSNMKQESITNALVTKISQ